MTQEELLETLEELRAERDELRDEADEAQEELKAAQQRVANLEGALEAVKADMLYTIDRVL